MSLHFSPLLSSSSGNASLISNGQTSILVDAGATGSILEKMLRDVGQNAANLAGILITHEHVDHIKGVGVLSRKYNLPIYANSATWEQMQPKIGEIALHNIRIIEKTEFFIRNFCILPIPLCHDAADPVGYSIMSGNRKISILTDTGKISEKMLDAAAGSTIVLLEANHDLEMLKNGKYPCHLKNRILSSKGHLSNIKAGAAAVELYQRGVRGIVLGHISSQNNIKQLAYHTVLTQCEQAGIIIGKDMALTTANRKSITGTFQLK